MCSLKVVSYLPSGIVTNLNFKDAVLQNPNAHIDYQFHTQATNMESNTISGMPICFLWIFGYRTNA
jgi:hypothetical protein